MTQTREEEVLWMGLVFAPFIVWFWIQVAKSHGVTLSKSKIRGEVAWWLKSGYVGPVLTPILFFFVGAWFITVYMPDATGGWLFLLISSLMSSTLYEQARSGDGILEIVGTFVGAWVLMIVVGALVVGLSFVLGYALFPLLTFGYLVLVIDYDPRS